MGRIRDAISSAFRSLVGRNVAPTRPTVIRVNRDPKSAIRASYDTAATTVRNERSWQYADTLDADSANSPEVRAILRKRARYVVQNNGYAAGMIRTLAADVVGPGAQLQHRSRSARSDELIESAWLEWCEETGFWEKVRTAVAAWMTDGEVFARNYQRNGLSVPYDIQMVEADQVATPDASMVSDTAVDGIRFDRFGNPTEYHVLKSHPGSNAWTDMDYLAIPAKEICHLFDCDRPGQHRGIPRITPSLDLYENIRRYTKATVLAAEFAASISGAIQTRAAALDADTEGTDIEDSENYPTIEIELGTVPVMPEGWEFKQIQPEQPTTTYEMFVTSLLREAARPLSMPTNVAMCDSSKYNYASGRLDHQTYDRQIANDRRTLERRMINRVFRAWRDVYVLSVLRAPELVGMPASVQWYWQPRKHVDPAKEASAIVTLLEAGLTSREAYWQEMGLDPDVMRAEVERDAEEGYGPAAKPSPSSESTTPPDESDDEPNPDTDEDFSDE